MVSHPTSRGSLVRAIIGASARERSGRAGQAPTSEASSLATRATQDAVRHTVVFGRRVRGPTTMSGGVTSTVVAGTQKSPSACRYLSVGGYGACGRVREG